MAKQQPNNRQAEMIRCENCGEDYSATYRCCPFCDEKPGRRVDEYGLSTKNPLQLAVLVITLVVILAAAFIVFSKVAPLLSSRDPGTPEVTEPVGDQPITGSDLVPSNTDEPTEPGAETPTEPEVPGDSDAIPATAIVLSREDFTLLPGETYTLTATVAPANTTNVMIWGCDRPDVLSVDQNGNVTNKNTTGDKVVVTLTVLAGNVKAECLVRCNSAPGTGGSTGDTTTPSESGSQSGGSTGSTVSKNTNAKVVGAGSGLNVRSGPGSSYEKVASIQNGNSVVILEDLGNGWYKIDYGAGKTGYASAQFIQPK